MGDRFIFRLEVVLRVMNFYSCLFDVVSFRNEIIFFTVIMNFSFFGRK